MVLIPSLSSDSWYQGTALLLGHSEPAALNPDLEHYFVLKGLTRLSSEANQTSERWTPCMVSPRICVFLQRYGSWIYTSSQCASLTCAKDMPMVCGLILKFYFLIFYAYNVPNPFRCSGSIIKEKNKNLHKEMWCLKNVVWKDLVLLFISRSVADTRSKQCIAVWTVQGHSQCTLPAAVEGSAGRRTRGLMLATARRKRGLTTGYRGHTPSISSSTERNSAF